MQDLKNGKKRITANFIDKTLGGRKHVTYRLIIHSKLPEFIKEHFYVLARKHIKTEKPVDINFDASIDYDDREIKMAMETLMIAMMNNVLFSQQEVETNIAYAINRRIDLLIDPLTTLEKTYFHENKVYDNAVFCRSLQRLSFGIPFVDGVIAKVKAYRRAIESEHFREISNAVKHELYDREKQKALISEFDLLLSLFKTDEMIASRGLGYEIVEMMFISRGLHDALHVVKKKERQGKKWWRTEDIVDLFSFVLNPQVEKRAKAAVEEKDETEDIIGLPRVIYPDDDKSIKIKRKKIERQPPGPYPSVFNLMEKKDYKALLKKLFKKDEKAFVHFINRVDKEDQWRKAKQIIDLELEKRNLDKFSREALKLGNIVFSKYFHYTY